MRNNIHFLDLTLQGCQKGHHILDLLGRKDRPASPSRMHSGESFDTIEGRHYGCRVQPRRIDNPKPKLTFRPPRASSSKVRSDIALNPLLREGTRMAEETGALSTEENRATSGGVTF